MNGRVAVATAIIGAIASIVVAVIETYKKEPSPPPVPPPQEEKRVAPEGNSPEENARSIAEVGKGVIKSTVRDLGGAVTCHEEQTGDSVAVTFYAKKEFYPVGTYQLEKAPSARQLAENLSVLHEALSRYQLSNFWVTTQVRGAADATPVLGNLDYYGLEAECQTPSAARALRAGGRTLDNELLACARAATFVQYLLDHGVSPRSTLVAGSGLEEEGGRYRYVDVTLTFHNILRWAPEASFCG